MPKTKPPKPIYTVTAALPYANGPIHFGHLSGAYLPADIYVRYLRAQGAEVLFVCGSDEGGVAILIQAKKEGISPQELVNKYHHRNKKAFEEFGISFDIFARTSDPIHYETAQAFFLKLHQEGKIYKQESEQYYDAQEHMFLADRYLQGTCPHCSFEEAYGDQCEACGTSLDSEDLLNPISRISGTPPIRKKTEHWYLPLDEHVDFLEQWILKEHADWKPNVLGQCKSWLQQGLHSRAITRDLSWGVPVPLAGAEGKVLYVWFEAPIGYISATKAWALEHNKDWRLFWQGANTQLIHFVGKDNIVFHCIIFPAMLKAHGSYILPAQVPANEFMTLEGKKISTSRNHAVWLEDFLADYPGKQDVLRYVLCANAPETKDSNFTWEDFQKRNNDELVGVFGNFVHRTLSLTEKYHKGIVPVPSTQTLLEREVAACLPELQKELETLLTGFHFRKAQEQLLELARIGNKYLADTEPWKLLERDPARVATILYTSLQLVAHLAIFCAPFLPLTSDNLKKMIALPALSWADASKFDLLPAGHKLGTVKMLFEKIE